MIDGESVTEILNRTHWFFPSGGRKKNGVFSPPDSCGEKIRGQDLMWQYELLIWSLGRDLAWRKPRLSSDRTVQWDRHLCIPFWVNLMACEGPRNETCQQPENSRKQRLHSMTPNTWLRLQQGECHQVSSLFWLDEQNHPLYWPLLQIHCCLNSLTL